MNALVLMPGRRNLGYAVHRELGGDAMLAGTLDAYRARSAQVCVQRLRQVTGWAGLAEPVDVIGLRALYGGDEFTGPVVVDDEVITRLERLTPEAPLHIPGLLEITRAVRETFPDVRCVATFETSFFVSLPARERTYAVEAKLAALLHLRRWGWHGLFHEAASAEAGRRWRAAGNGGVPRILSICLEPRPELAAIFGRQPVSVTSGATPLEGLPGETTCGEIDATVPLALARASGLGPEAVNKILTEESGLSGLAGRPVRLSEILEERGSSLHQEHKLLLYRLLLACGAGAAALGGIDAIVFSGRYASSGYAIGPELVARLAKSGAADAARVRYECFSEGLSSIVAGLALVRAGSKSEAPALAGERAAGK